MSEIKRSGARGPAGRQEEVAPERGGGGIGRRTSLRCLPRLGSHGQTFDGYRLFPSPATHGNQVSRRNRYRTAASERRAPAPVPALPCWEFGWRQAATGHGNNRRCAGPSI